MVNLRLVPLRHHKARVHMSNALPTLSTMVRVPRLDRHITRSFIKAQLHNSPIPIPLALITPQCPHFPIPLDDPLRRVLIFPKKLDFPIDIFEPKCHRLLASWSNDVVQHLTVPMLRLIPLLNIFQPTDKVLMSAHFAIADRFPRLAGQVVMLLGCDLLVEIGGEGAESFEYGWASRTTLNDFESSDYGIEGWADVGIAMAMDNTFAADDGDVVVAEQLGIGVLVSYEYRKAEDEMRV